MTDFVGTKDTLFIIHGWKSSSESSINYKIKENILSQNDLNVFVVDWSPIAGQTYKIAHEAVVKVGVYVAGFVSELKSQYGLNIRKVKFVGHSLGAHVAGCAGRELYLCNNLILGKIMFLGAALDGQVERILGLDPAGPGFTAENLTTRLDKGDARMVSVIHTNGDLLGLGISMGHADYWPNGGKSQPGCILDITGLCSHVRAYEYYTESLISSKDFIATKCTSYSDYTAGKCSFEDISYMGKFVSDYG